MHGRLTRWLCLLGYDTYYDPQLSDINLLRIAQVTKRIVITADQEMSQSGKKLGICIIFLSPKYGMHQLRNILNFTNSEPSLHHIGTRCTQCNFSLHAIPRENISQWLPLLDAIESSIIQHHHLFWVCFSCRQLYWYGTVWKQILLQFKQFFKE